LSADGKTPGGERTTFVFIVSKWFGVRGLSEPGSFKRSTVNGQLLMMASTSHMSVLSDSSSKKWGQHASDCMDLQLPNSTHVARRRNIHSEGEPITIILK